MNHAWRLAEGQWTFQAMSPYTAPWAHYWAALWMKLFGPSLEIFRLSQVWLCFSGVFFLGLTLWERGQKKAVLYFPLVLSLLPALFMNHRFAIELTGFHVLCCGALLWCLQRQWIMAVVFWAVLGSTGHILFYGFVLALLGTAFLEGQIFNKRQRMAIVIGALLLAAFFFTVWQAVPEKGKALALLLSAIGVAVAVFFQAEAWSVWRYRWWDKVFCFMALIFLGNGLFFLEGSWSLALSTGLPFSYLGLFFLPLLAFLVWQGRLNEPDQRLFLLSIIFLGFMMLKPAPRYFEIPFLGAAIFASVGFSRLAPLFRIGIFGCLLAHSGWLWAPYFRTLPIESSQHFLFFKDSSRDFLSKQTLAAVLDSYGCNLSDINSVDSRVREALVALELSSSKEKSSCPWKNLQVVRKSEAGTAKGIEVADFVIGGNP